MPGSGCIFAALHMQYSVCTLYRQHPQLESSIVMMAAAALDRVQCTRCPACQACTLLVMARPGSAAADEHPTGELCTPEELVFLGVLKVHKVAPIIMA